MSGMYNRVRTVMRIGDPGKKAKRETFSIYFLNMDVPSAKDSSRKTIRAGLKCSRIKKLKILNCKLYDELIYVVETTYLKNTN